MATVRGADPSLAPAALEAFLAYYHAHKLDHTRVYPGVREQLEQLAETGVVRMAVLTNKPVRASREICEALGLAPFFFAVYGGNSFATKKPEAEGLLRLMDEAGAQPAATVMIGDSDVDVRTALGAGAWSLGCRWGLAPQTMAAMEARGMVDVVVDRAEEWAEVLGAPASIPVASSESAQAVRIGF